jgi:hypothetical protein
VSSMRWAGGEAPIRPADQPPAPLMHGPMMRAAEQGQVRQVGGATIYPVVKMMRVTPAQRPITTREHTATVPYRQGGPLGRLHDPGGPAHVQGLAGGPTQDRGEQGHGRPQPPLKSRRLAGVGVDAGVVDGAGRIGINLGGGRAADQDSGDGPVTGQPLTRLRGQRPRPPDLHPRCRVGPGGCQDPR